MAFKFRRGTSAERLQLSGGTYGIPPVGEPLWNTDTEVLYMGDGVTPGGNPIRSFRRTRKKVFYIESPLADEEYPLFSVPSAMTIQRVTSVTNWGTVEWNLEERSEATPMSAGTKVWTNEQVASSTMSASTTFNNASLDADDWIYYSASSVDSGPSKLWVTVKFTED
jgi:hypothetical protein